MAVNKGYHVLSEDICPNTRQQQRIIPKSNVMLLTVSVNVFRPYMFHSEMESDLIAAIVATNGHKANFQF